MNFKEFAQKNIVIFDGAMGTTIQSYELNESDFCGHPNCNEYLNICQENIIYEIHKNFFKAGAKVVETNTFGGTRLVLSEFGLEDKVFEINFKGAKIAKKAALEFNGYVAGSIGPGTKLPSLGHISYDDLFEMYVEQADALIDGGVDLFIIETCQDLLQVKAAINAVTHSMKNKNIELPIMVSLTLEQNGTMLLGSDISAIVATLSDYPVFSLGINCSLGPDMMEKFISDFRKIYNGRLSCIPNAGLPETINGKFVYNMTPDKMADIVYNLVKKYDLDIIGGCCGTTYEHIKKISEIVKDIKPSPKPFKISARGMVSSLYTGSSLTQDPPPAIIGERANANGSKAFRELLLKEDFDGMLKIAKDQEGSSHLIDVCVAYAGRNELKDIAKFVSLLNQKLIAPIVIDSTEPPAILEALKRYAGKPVINSINLEDGGEKLHKILNIVKQFPAAVIALTIDEKGMAMDANGKFEIAQKIYDIWVNEYNLNPEDLIFDPLTFSIGSGDKTLRYAALETIEAIKMIKNRLKGAKTVLGVSNVSFGLSPASRVILNSVFLSRAVKSGLDMAIVHATKVIPESSINPTELKLCNNLIDGKENALDEFIEYFSKQSGNTVDKVVDVNLSDEEKLKSKLIKGDLTELESLLDSLLINLKPVDIINKILMPAMQEVGELFGSGKMLLPFVLQSAEVMKKSVNYLERFMEKNTSEVKGKIVLATVKGDVHDIGKNLVDIILSNNGYEVYNLGIKVEVQDMIKKAQEVNADAIGMSGLLVKSTLIMKENLEEISKHNMNLKILLGGAALTEGYVVNECEPIIPGAVFYCRDAFNAITYLSEEKVTVRKASKSNKDKKSTLKSENTRIDRTVNLNINPPFIGYRSVEDIKIREFSNYINKYTLFTTRWGFKKNNMTESEFDEVLNTTNDTFNQMLETVISENIIVPKVSYGYFYCKAENNALKIYDESKSEIAKFEFPRQAKEPYLCLSDYFKDDEFDILPMQVVTIGEKTVEFCKKLHDESKYKDYFLYHGLFTEITEALAEYWHLKIRKELKIDNEYDKNIESILRQKYQGKRYSFGYPSCPDLQGNETIGKLLNMKSIGVNLTETFLMVPEFSTSAIILYNPNAEYFTE
ncbi:MAG: 5-methyltetrahydrofolate--homocysteine methyltransferase [Deferribacteres bacterium]|nr:5-methyltetrahydrofolate--homocysteine methyltransferase [Deferribacteres bacterium]